MPKKILFIIQASKSVGLGHLFRSKAIIEYCTSKGLDCEVIPIFDQYAQNIANNFNLKLISLKEADPASALVIDAVSLPEEMTMKLIKFNNRVLISPVFNSPLIPTNILLRDKMGFFKNDIFSSFTEVKIDPSYGFVTTKISDPGKRFDFSFLDVGICLSGGDSSESIEKSLIEKLQYLDIVRSIKLISRNHLDTPNYNQKVTITNFSKDPWHYFKDINLFIGGEGMMIYEAISRCVPPVSIINSSNRGKNDILLKGNLCFDILRDELLSNKLEKFLSKIDLIENLQDSISEYIDKVDIHSLPKEIFRITTGKNNEYCK